MPSIASHPNPVERLASSPIALEQLHTLYTANPHFAIFTLDPEGYITTWNTGAIRIKGYGVEEAVGRHFSMLYPDDARDRGEPMAHLQAALAEGSYREQGFRRRKNGQLYFADVQITPMFQDGALVGYSKIVSDISEQGNLRRERDESRAQMTELQIQKNMRERFVLTLTHDLRNPLSTIQTATELILKNPDNLALHQRLADVSLRSAHRMERMIVDLLDANRIAARERLPLRLETFDLAAAVREVFAEMVVVHGNRFRLTGEEELIGTWDKSQLKRAVENLLVNAIKYGDLEKPITVHLESMGNTVCVTVQNFGDPIPPEYQHTIFEQFRRTRIAEEGKEKGWGIGLTLVRGIAEAHQGTLSLKSDTQSGTRFKIEMPRDLRNLH